MPANDHVPRAGYEGRKTGTPSGRYPSEEHLRPDKGYEARPTGTKPTTYPNDSRLTPRQGFKGRGSTGDGDRPDVPAPNTVEPIAWRETPRPDDLNAPR